jgi:hypothetical protein
MPFAPPKSREDYELEIVGEVEGSAVEEEEVVEL